MTVTPLNSYDAHSRPDLDGVLVEDLPMPDIDALVARTSALLAGGVPLTLLLDLAAGPHSEELWADESPELAWLLPRNGSGVLRDAV